MLITPGGILAWWASSIRARADKGVSLGGLTTQVQPAARAAPTFIWLGEYQGLNMNSISLMLVGLTANSPPTRLASSLNHSMKEFP